MRHQPCTLPEAPCTGPRQQALADAGAPACGEHPAWGVRHWFGFVTADVMTDYENGWLYVAVDPEPTAADWEAACAVMEAALGPGSMTSPSCDIGEPVYDPAGDVYVWRIAIGQGTGVVS